MACDLDAKNLHSNRLLTEATEFAYRGRFLLRTRAGPVDFFGNLGGRKRALASPDSLDSAITIATSPKPIRDLANDRYHSPSASPRACAKCVQPSLRQSGDSRKLSTDVQQPTTGRDEALSVFKADVPGHPKSVFDVMRPTRSAFTEQWRIP